MKCTVNKNDVIDILSRVQGLTGRRSNLTITENVLIRAADKGITLIATDLETGFEGTYPATIRKGGTIAINARKFYEIVREFPSDDIRLNEVENRWIEIGNKTVQYHIMGMNPEDFPDSPHFEDVAGIEIESAALKKMIEKTVMIGGASDDKRAHINGIYFENVTSDAGAFIRMVSTDGSRLSTVDQPCDTPIDLKPGTGLIIPKKGLNEVNKFLDVEGTVTIGFKDNHFVVKKATETIIIRLLDGEFPKYQDIIAKKEGHTIALEKDAFTMMLKRMSILTSENYKGAIFKFDQNQLEITATNPDIGESKENMPIDFLGDAIEVAFNPKFFIETLNVIEDDKVVVDLIDEEKPCLLTGETDAHFLSVIMPMRI
jgi:DNA polymerase-3 subunit beta